MEIRFYDLIKEVGWRLVTDKAHKKPNVVSHVSRKVMA